MTARPLGHPGRLATVVVGLINFVHNLRRLATMHRQALAQAGR